MCLYLRWTPLDTTAHAPRQLRLLQQAMRTPTRHRWQAVLQAVPDFVREILEAEYDYEW